ncbi:MAG: O-antigen ligase family protein [Rhodospirillaceae bacterium]
MSIEWFAIPFSSALLLCSLLALPVIGLLAGPLFAALVFGLGGASALLAGPIQRLRPDRPLATLAFGFAALSWLSTLWSIVPGHSAAAAAQLSLILTAALIVLAMPRPDPGFRVIVIRWLPRAMAFGIALLCIDTIFGYPLQGMMGHDGTKYNRGLNYLVLIVWPLLAALAVERRWLSVLVITALMTTAITVGVSTTGTLALATGGATLVLALLLRSLAPAALFALVATVVVTLPVLLRTIATARQSLWPYIKASGFHRLEIWDYMTARVFEHPWLGWGLLSAKFVPIRPEELATYHYANDSGIYPHNQWLELWLETGALGAALGLAFLGLLLWRIRSTLSVKSQPFALAACGSALVISSFNFEITTDSWWAALTVTALLFKVLRD